MQIANTAHFHSPDSWADEDWEYPTLETDISDQFTMRDRASPPSMHVSVYTTGRLFRRYTRVWSEAQRGSLVGRFEFISLEAPGTKAPGDGIGITMAAWPRVLQIGSRHSRLLRVSSPPRMRFLPVLV